MFAKFMFEVLFLIYLSAIATHSLPLKNETEFQLIDNTYGFYGGTKIGSSRAITLKNCGQTHVKIKSSSVGNKIVGGQEAQNGQFPWQVLLYIFDARGGRVQCGGSILNEHWILTAGHCVADERSGQLFANRIEVAAGIHDTRARGPRTQTRSAACVEPHPGWRGSVGQFKNDLALVKLQQPLDITFENGGIINGVCLPEPNFEYVGKARISGWGLTRDRGQPSPVLKFTDISVIDAKTCRRYPYPVPIADSMICQGVDRTAPCQGDSGGPLVIPKDNRMVQIGVVSFGPGQCANNNTPNAVYTKVSNYIDWIQRTINALNASSKCRTRSLELPKTEQKPVDFNIPNNTSI